LEKLSPRSYVTGGFDIIKPSIIDFIGKALRKNSKSWWFDNIHSKLKNERGDITQSGTISDLYNVLDEALCFKVIRYNNKIFIKEIGHNGMNLVNNLYAIRNAWAHTPGKGMTENDGDNALQIMIELMQLIDNDAIIRLYSIKDQMHKYYYSDKNVISTKENLINFLNDKILLPVINDGRDTLIVKEAKNRVYHTQEYFENMKTAEEVVDFFWDNIVNNPRGLESHKILKECGFTTFEDVRKEFNTLCYGIE